MNSHNQVHGSSDNSNKIVPAQAPSVAGKEDSLWYAIPTVTDEKWLVADDDFKCRRCGSDAFADDSLHLEPPSVKLTLCGDCGTLSYVYLPERNGSRPRLLRAVSDDGTQCLCVASGYRLAWTADKLVSVDVRENWLEITEAEHLADDLEELSDRLDRDDPPSRDWRWNPPVVDPHRLGSLRPIKGFDVLGIREEGKKGIAFRGLPHALTTRQSRRLAHELRALAEG